MNKKQYLAMRKKLMDETQAMIDAGKAAKAEEKMKEVAALDEKWDAIAQAQANFNALNNEPEVMTPDHMEDSTDGGKDPENDLTRVWSSDEYKTAWAKTLMGKQLTADEQKT